MQARCTTGYGKATMFYPKYRRPESSYKNQNSMRSILGDLFFVKLSLYFKQDRACTT
jgi:hypothetical protein